MPALLHLILLFRYYAFKEMRAAITQVNITACAVRELRMAVQHQNMVAILASSAVIYTDKAKYAIFIFAIRRCGTFPMRHHKRTA